MDRIVAFYNNIALASFLIGGAFGGILFGMLSDRIGRTKTMIYDHPDVLLLHLRDGVCPTWWQMVVLRFLVAMGVGGEWAVASAMVAEVFPKKARAWSLGIFHASSVFGTYLAVLAGAFVVGNQQLGPWGWRIGFRHRGLARPADALDPLEAARAGPMGPGPRSRQDRTAPRQTGRLLDLFAPP